jgi:hypothetical protein
VPKTTFARWFGGVTFLLDVALFVVPKGYRVQFAAAMLVLFEAWYLTT